MLRSSTVDLLVSRDRIGNIRRIDTYVALVSDHFPVAFDVVEGAKLYYSVSLRKVMKQFNR